MPRATVNTQDVVRKDLKTCPGGYVELRRLSYGEWIQRRDLMGDLKFRDDGKGKRSRDTEAILQAANLRVTQFEFSRCITDHNLEDEDGRKLNLSNPSDFAKLDTRIGQEIGDYIDEMNQLPEEEEEGNLEVE